MAIYHLSVTTGSRNIGNLSACRADWSAAWQAYLVALDAHARERARVRLARATGARPWCEGLGRERCLSSPLVLHVLGSTNHVSPR